VSHSKSRSWLYRGLAQTLVVSQIAIGIPLPAQAAAPRQERDATPPPADPRPEPAPPARLAHASPFRSVPLPPLRIPADPSDEEISGLRILDEPLYPVLGQPIPGENRLLAAALSRFMAASGAERLAALRSFVMSYPASRWHAAVALDLGLLYRREGYYSRAIEALEDAWSLSRNETAPLAHAGADRAVGELASLYDGLGRVDQLEALLAEIKDRDVRGSAGEKVFASRQGLATMKSSSESAFRCGPAAVAALLGKVLDEEQVKLVNETKATAQGTSMDMLRELGNRIGLQLQAARRVADVPLLIPSVAHLRSGHFAALTRETAGRYRVLDPSLSESLWVSRDAVNDESSGYFLVRAGVLPTGWVTVGPGEASTVWGKRYPTKPNPPDYRPGDPQEPPGGCPPGMPGYSVHSMLVNLHVTDVPLRYSPPRGPAIEFRLTYNSREIFQPATFTYSNLGAKWTFDWMSYIQDNSPPIGDVTQTAQLYLQGGGYDTYAGYQPIGQPVTSGVYPQEPRGPDPDRDGQLPARPSRRFVRALHIRPGRVDSPDLHDAAGRSAAVLTDLRVYIGRRIGYQARLGHRFPGAGDVAPL
jgi:hypothetical protein